MRTALWLAAGALLWTGFAPGVSAQELKPPQQPHQTQPLPPPNGSSGSSNAPPSSPGRAPGDTLNRSGGVLTPPPTGDQGVLPPPASGSSNMPVIHPPGTPGGNGEVQPK
jgi:hypothetical protein